MYIFIDDGQWSKIFEVVRWPIIFRSYELFVCVIGIQSLLRFFNNYNR